MQLCSLVAGILHASHRCNRCFKFFWKSCFKDNDLRIMEVIVNLVSIELLFLNSSEYSGLVVKQQRIIVYCAEKNLQFISLSRRCLEAHHHKGSCIALISGDLPYITTAKSVLSCLERHSLLLPFALGSLSGM